MVCGGDMNISLKSSPSTLAEAFLNFNHCVPFIKLRSAKTSTLKIHLHNLIA